MDRICTIVALNYLPQAMALLESTRKLYPDIEFFVLIIDAKSNELPYLHTATILVPEDLDIETLWLAQMRSYYDAMELATSLKPFLLETLLVKGVSSVTFLDPDILLYAELSEGMTAAKEFGIALTPHRLTPAHIANSDFTELAFLQFGIFNLGYIAVGQKSKPMLSWWGERLRWFCTKYPKDPVFTDQKWLNFVPAFFEHKIIQNPGYNFASWNINERPLSGQDNELCINGHKLVFIHFSQMSGLLMRGKSVDHWEKSLTNVPNSSKSLEIVSELTHQYSKTLVANRKMITEYESFSKFYLQSSFHSKRKLIAKNMNDTSLVRLHNNPALHFISTRKNFVRITLLLEKSASLNGLRDGLLQDYQKIRIKFMSTSVASKSRGKSRG